jgi:drug/metabolite transporter (DMT)-like permease
MSKQQQFRRSYTRVMSVLMIVIGVALVVRTVAAGGGAAAAGVVLGILFVLAGGARLYLQHRRR